MPIVNGTYVPETLGDAKPAQEKVFGTYSRRDMNDYSAAAYNYLMKQQEQAYNLQLWNLTNEYNSPAAQMKRYQDAGLNPNLIYGQQNTANAPSAASAPSFRSGNVQARKQQNAINMIGEFTQIVKQAKDIWDYAKFGAEGHGLQNQTLGKQLEKYQEEVYNLAYENEWLWYLMTGQGGYADPEGVFHSFKEGPQGKMYDAEYNLKRSQKSLSDQNINRVRAMASMIPDQQARTKALQALDEYRLQILQGQNDIVLNLNTGNDIADAFLRALIFFGMSKL